MLAGYLQGCVGVADAFGFAPGRVVCQDHGPPVGFAIGHQILQVSCMHPLVNTSKYPFTNTIGDKYPHRLLID